MTEQDQVELSLGEAMGCMVDSGYEPHRLRLLDRDGREFARLTGRLVQEDDLVRVEGEAFAEVEIGDGGLSAAVRLLYDKETIRCTVSEDGTITGTLPSGAMWIWDRGEDG